MILAGGRILDTDRQEELLDTLEDRINRTREQGELSPQTVIEAADRLGTLIAEGAFDSFLEDWKLEGAEHYKNQIIQALDRKSLTYRWERELGSGSWIPQREQPPFENPTEIVTRVMPLGTLLHIAAGNVDGLPAFSVAEGLLTGNVNLLKLPQADHGLSIEILRRWIEIEPRLADYLYVFDTPSSDVVTLKRLADMADGIVVWGGEAAVSAVRRFAPTGARLIEWGHKLGFVYLSGYTDKERELTGLANHIQSTRQLLCSSCQTIFIDTEEEEEAAAFCREFLPYLEASARRYASQDLSVTAEVTLRRYSQELEKALSDEAVPTGRVFQGDGGSLTLLPDEELELSPMFGNCLVKRLPHRRLFQQLRRHKGCLQTAGLICLPEKRAELTELLARSGVVRIMHPGDMSAGFCGEAHDGEYPLRRYTRIVHTQISREP